MRFASWRLAGQEIMTADKVTLRLNALVTYRVTDARLAVSVVDDARQALYRETQLVLRALVGARELDGFLADKDGVVQELEQGLRRRVPALGLEVIAAGIRDVILPGEMKEPPQQGDRSPQGCRGEPDRTPRGDGRHAQPGQHGQAAPGQPDAHAPA